MVWVRPRGRDFDLFWAFCARAGVDFPVFGLVGLVGEVSKTWGGSFLSMAKRFNTMAEMYYSLDLVGFLGVFRVAQVNFWQEKGMKYANTRKISVRGNWIPIIQTRDAYHRNTANRVFWFGQYSLTPIIVNETEEPQY